MTLRRILTLIGVTLALQVQAQSGADDLIVEMQQAYRQGNAVRLAQLLPLVRGHALEPWAAYWELKNRLETASPQEIQDFFARYAGTYQEDRLRNDWLLLLGQRRDWATFAAEYPKYRMNDDREVRCYGLLATHLLQGAAEPENLAEEVRRNWLAEREPDDGCTIAAATLIADGQGPHRMTVQDAWRKARLAVEANRPRSARNAVQIAAPDAVAQFAELNSSPTRYLTSRVFVASRVRKEMMVLALIKLATTDLDNAARQLEDKWGPQLAPEERNWVWGVIGKLAAQHLNSDAMARYAKVSRDKDLTDDMLAWKVRAALRTPRGYQWASVLEAIGAMSEAAQADPAWIYWKARALLARGGDEPREQAQRLLESIATIRTFYGQLALEEMGRKITIPPKPAPLTPEEKESARLNPSLNRGLYAIELGIRSEGVREWNWGTSIARPGGLDDRELLAAAQMACDREVWDRCINTSDRTKGEFDIDQRFPTPFRDLVVRRSRDINLDPAYVYGLIRQESRFVMDARSHVGAAGLMQVMPATARWTARKIGLANFRPEQLHDQEINITIGTGYLKLVLDGFDGSMPLAAAAYNAGPARSRAWRNGPVMEAAAWAENVPFPETRDYVKKVLANTTIYSALLSGEPQSLRVRLGRIGPRDAAEPEALKDLP